ncbi:MAG: glycoside hydrolase [Actinomycetota bacterium]|nr:glycoside hydrolase [Actinomycetota bacterium]
MTDAVQVTDNPNYVRGHSSPQIARNPKTGELVILETEVYSGFGINVHVSNNDGRSWIRGGDPMMKPFTWNSDYAINGPYFTMAFDENGVLYVPFTAADPAMSNVNRAERPRPVFLAKSTDSGRTFTTSMVYRATPENPRTINNRRAMVAVDPKNSSNVYVAWIQSSTGEKSRSMIAASSDGGRTFRDAIDLAEPEPQGGYQPRPAVDSDGVVHAIFPGAGFTPQAPAGAPAPEAPVRPIFHRRSTDGGRTWSPQVKIDEGSAGFFHNRKQLLAADPNNGNLYAVWSGNEKTRPTYQDDNEIFVRVSRDGGRTWGDRVVVNDDAQSPTTQHYDPGIAIAPNGRVDIAWYDFRNSPMPEQIPATFAAPFNNGGFTDVYYAYSTDGGSVFSRNVRISDRMSDRHIGMWSNNVHSHYNVGISSSNDTVYFAWQDSRNGNSANDSEDIYFSSFLRNPPEVSVSDGSEVPGWALLGAGLALGLGGAMVTVYLVTRRSRLVRAPAAK